MVSQNTTTAMRRKAMDERVAALAMQGLLFHLLVTFWVVVS
jgi:hypothetical protein